MKVFEAIYGVPSVLGVASLRFRARQWSDANLGRKADVVLPISRDRACFRCKSQQIRTRPQRVNF